MVARATNRSILAYSLHGRMGSTVVDYPEFFRQLFRIPAAERQTSVGSNLVAVSSMVAVGPTWVLRMVAGEEGVAPVLFNPQTGEEAESELDGNILANAIWLMVNPTTRHVAIEQKRPGVPVSAVVRAWSHLGAEHGLTPSRATWDLNPIASPGFLADIKRFDRIREATVEVAEPNYSWHDQATILTGYAAASDGASAEVKVKAPRAGSLSTTQGIVADIKNLATSKISALKNVTIKGRRDGEGAESTTSLAKHQERTKYSSPINATLGDERVVFAESASALLNQIPEADDSVGPTE